MANSETNREVDLEKFLAATGNSLSAAQGSLTDGLDMSPNLVVSEAQLEVKAALNSDSEGRLAVQTISSKDISQGGIDPGLVSTMQINFLATPGEPQAEAAKPKKSPADVVKEVSKKNDVAALEKILGGLKYDATFVSDKKRWLVTVRDPKGRLVRESILDD
jgi:hypothetical protein